MPSIAMDGGRVRTQQMRDKAALCYFVFFLSSFTVAACQDGVLPLRAGKRPLCLQSCPVGVYWQRAAGGPASLSLFMHPSSSESCQVTPGAVTAPQFIVTSYAQLVLAASTIVNREVPSMQTPVQDGPLPSPCFGHSAPAPWYEGFAQCWVPLA